MTSQCTIAISPNGEYIAAQVHQYLSMVKRSGEAVLVPAPVYSRIESNENEDSGDESDGGNGEEGGAAAEGSEPAKKKVKQDNKNKGQDKGQRSHEGPKPIRALAFHPTSSEWFMYESEDKYLHLYHSHASYAGGFKHILTVNIPRKVQLAIFHPTAFSNSSSHQAPGTSQPLRLPHLIVSDKTGDVFVVSGEDLKTQSCELAHLAHITGMLYHVQSMGSEQSKRFLITTDSDAKVRVSNAPNYFDIQAFCMGHAAFVTASTVVPTSDINKTLVVSGGIGSELRVWKLNDGAEVRKIDLSAFKPADVASSSSPASASASPAVTAAQNESYISHLSYEVLQNGAKVLAVAVYPWPYVFLLHVDGEQQPANLITKHTAVRVSSTPMCVAVTPASSSSSSSASSQSIFIIDETLHARSYASSADGSEWTGSAATSSVLDNLNASFLAAQSDASEKVITQAQAAAFVGSGPPGEKNENNPQARYISPFSSTQQSASHSKLALLSPGGFTFRRYFDKIQRDAFVNEKKAQALQRQQQAKLDKKNKKEQEKKEKENQMNDGDADPDE